MATFPYKILPLVLLLSLMANVIPGEFTPAGEKMTHLHFYVHDILSGRNPFAIRVASAPRRPSALVSFGDTLVFDDPMTEGPSLRSKLVGRSQGIYSYVSERADALLLVFSFVFTEGEFNGSTLAIFGHDPVLDAVREIPVVGGSGQFRLARGYALVSSYFVNTTNADAILEWNVYVMHKY